MAPVLRALVLIVASALVHAARAAHINDTFFAVTVSSRVRGGQQEALCAQVHGAAESLALTVALQTDSGSTAILEQTVSEDFYRCVTFQVPAVRSATVATVSVTIRGASASVSRNTKILVEPASFIHIIQTDKPLYKPGQTVKFRIVSMDTNFIPVDRVYKLVELQDPESNRVAQWLDRAGGGGILDLSHPVIAEAAQGSYTITATTGRGERTSHSFDIKEYVLPKFEVTVELPAVITILDKEATLKICGKYTFGKPVVGSAKAELCRRSRRHRWSSPRRQKDACRTYEMTTDRSGCATRTVKLEAFGLNETAFRDTFEVTAELQEDGTGVVLKGSAQTGFSVSVRTVTFEDLPATYKPGIPLEGKVKLIGADKQAVANEAVYLSSHGTATATVTTDLRGVAFFSLDTALWNNTVFINASPRKEEPARYFSHERRPEYRSASAEVVPVYSKSDSVVTLVPPRAELACDEDATVRARYIIQGAELKKGQEAVDFFYLVMSRGGIVQHGRVPVAVTAGTVNKGEMSVTLHRVTDLAPVAQLVVYAVMPGGAVVADSHDFPVQLCLNNKVTLRFSSQQELPAGRTRLLLRAAPGSLCSVRAVDQSVLLLQPERELSVAQVYSRLPLQKLSGYSPDVEDPSSRLDCNSFMRPEPKNDVYTVFKSIGVKLLTNSDVKGPRECYEAFMYDDDVQDSPVSMAHEMPMAGILPRRKEEKKEVQTVRTYFPETWIWDLVPVGAGGSVEVEQTVPDTVTRWAASAFCVAAAGFGVAPGVGLTAFQPFFVSLTLPYSVVRGEAFALKATVFNYLSKCIMVNVTLAESDRYAAAACAGCLYSVCVCGGDSRTFSWTLSPTALGQVDLQVSAEALRTGSLCGNEVAIVPDAGRIDTVVRTLLVQAEGTPQMVSHNAVLCPKGGSVEKNVSLVLPHSAVEGSARASVSVLGDLMGRAMKNLDRLLAMPYGCGEQNMLLFAPNVFILDYLKTTGQLTRAIRDRATRFLESGYQRELTYKHDDGSYSAFGKRDESGNTWLTSFVLKSFGGARSYIFVDEGHMTSARRWLSGLQRADGCVRSVGKLLHNGMKGGVSDDVSLTAYIIAALLELHGNATDLVVQKGLSCLREAVSGKVDPRDPRDPLDHLYTTALMAYTFALAGDAEMKSKLVTHLHHKSDTRGGTRHWTRAGASGKSLDSLEVEMTAYVLLALLSGPPTPGFGLDYSSGIVRWLTQNQNPYGGFSSTQDTVVALQALAKYGAATYSAQGVTTVTVAAPGGGAPDREFRVEQSNRLLYQEEPLSRVPGDYVVRAEGQSCVLTQISLHYNVPPPPDSSSFNISTDIIAKCNISRPQVILVVTVRYQGRREETNMVLINIKLLSGYALHPSSLQLLKQVDGVRRVDVEDGFVNIYVREMKKSEERTHLLTLEEDVPVRNLKPAVVKVYDYYQTSDEAVTDYTSPCGEHDDVNEL
ncbi:alpha-2-macroglobulin isoform X2 [Pseudoliparis swirei]|uniref:alpha-2-macroglobulin isoform X2 n=1 Tax=Pseudoliparis swirei TaxID=2059687 RepID=UPI0024BEBB0A|nr:alpha-2-macroglobulin isoform X2 [Pseudoliparis swirei]